MYFIWAILVCYLLLPLLSFFPGEWNISFAIADVLDWVCPFPGTELESATCKVSNNWSKIIGKLFHKKVIRDILGKVQKVESYTVLENKWVDCITRYSGCCGCITGIRGQA